MDGHVIRRRGDHDRRHGDANVRRPWSEHLPGEYGGERGAQRRGGDRRLWFVECQECSRCPRRGRDAEQQPRHSDAGHSSGILHRGKDPGRPHPVGHPIDDPRPPHGLLRHDGTGQATPSPLAPRPPPLPSHPSVQSATRPRRSRWKSSLRPRQP